MRSAKSRWCCLTAEVCVSRFFRFTRNSTIPNFISNCAGVHRSFRGGRTVAISGVPQQLQCFYMAAVNGGVWKTTDFGKTRGCDFAMTKLPALSARGGLRIRSQHPLCRRGEGLQRQRPGGGDGVIKSIDAVRRWNHLGLRDATADYAIFVDPRTPDRGIRFRARASDGPDVERGIFRRSRRENFRESSL